MLNNGSFANIKRINHDYITVDDYNQKFNFLNYICDELCTAHEDKINWSRNITLPIDEKIQKCYDNIRQYIFDQNNAVLACVYYNGKNTSILIKLVKGYEECYVVKLRLHEIWYKNTILEGQWALNQAHYEPEKWSNVSKYMHSIMPTGPQIEFEDSEEESISEEISEESEENIEPKKIKLDLGHRVGSVFKEIPQQQTREFRSTFYIRNIIILSGTKFSKNSPEQFAEELSNLNNHLENYYIPDTIISNLLLVNNLSGVYTHQYKKDSVSFKLALYKLIPYYTLHKKITQHIQAIPTLSEDYDYNNNMYAFISYASHEKPGVYFLSVINDKKDIEFPLDRTQLLYSKIDNKCGLNLISVFFAYIPTLEVQQYIVHLIKTRGTNKKIVMKCIKSEKGWTPILFMQNKDPDKLSQIRF